MKWYERFSNKITSLMPKRDARAVAVALSSLNPDHIQVENVRNLLNVSFNEARQVCEIAVKRGTFLPRIQLICPDDSVALTVSPEDSIPETIRCWHRSDDGLEPEELRTATLQRREFYVLNER